MVAKFSSKNYVTDFLIFFEMPLGSNFWIFTKSVVDLERDDYGIYELLDASNNIVYIGFGMVRCLLLEHFPDGPLPITGAKWFSVEYTWDESRARKKYDAELSKYYEKYGKYPRFNNFK